MCIRVSIVLIQYSKLCFILSLYCRESEFINQRLGGVLPISVDFSGYNDGEDDDDSGDDGDNDGSDDDEGGDNDDNAVHVHEFTRI